MDSSFFMNEGAEGPTMDFDKSPAILAVMAANKFTRKTSRLFQRDFGIGAMDWRMLVMLTQEKNVTVARATEVIGIDKGAISRALSRLHEKGLISYKAPKNDPRRKSWTLTSAGKDLHADILDSAMEMQDKLLDGFTYLEVKTLNKLMHQMLENIEEM